MKIAFAGKGGVGKTTLCAWMGDYLARMGHNVLLVDADTALSLGHACGLSADALPTPLCEREDLVRERIGSGGGFLDLNPAVADLPEMLAVDLPMGLPVDSAHNAGRGPGRKRLLVMGSIAGAGEGCACAANALLKSLLVHLVTTEDTWVLVDLEAGVEHLGRGTVADVDGLVVVTEPSLRSLETAAQVGGLAARLGLGRQVLAVNRSPGARAMPPLEGLPQDVVHIGHSAALQERQFYDGCVLGLEGTDMDAQCAALLHSLQAYQ